MCSIAKSDTRCGGESGCDLLSDFPVFRPKEQKRIPVADDHLLYLSNEDSVIPRDLRRVQPAFEERQGSMQHGSSMVGPVEARAGLGLCILVSAFRSGVIVGDGELTFAQNIDAEALLCVQVSMRARAVIHANQH